MADNAEYEYDLLVIGAGSGVFAPHGWQLQPVPELL